MNDREPHERHDRAGAFSRRDCLRLGVAGAGAFGFGLERKAFSEDTRKPAAGKIYLATDMRFEPEDAPVTLTLVAIDVATGACTKVLERCGRDPRVSPDGRRVASTHEGAVHVCELKGGSAPVRILSLREGEYAAPACWSADGRQLIVSLYTREDANAQSVSRTWLMNVDGSGRVELPLSSADLVRDWSADGRWLLTLTDRDAKIGRQLFVVRPEGSGARALTRSGHAHYPRFAPDSRRVVYTLVDSLEEFGIYSIDIEGKHRRKLLPSGAIPVVACWSPDGKRLAVAYKDAWRIRSEQVVSRVELLDLEGDQRTVFNTEGRIPADPLDWR